MKERQQNEIFFGDVKEVIQMMETYTTDKLTPMSKIIDFIETNFYMVNDKSFTMRFITNTIAIGINQIYRDLCKTSSDWSLPYVEMMYRKSKEQRRRYKEWRRISLYHDLIGYGFDKKMAHKLSKKLTKFSGSSISIYTKEVYSEELPKLFRKYDGKRFFAIGLTAIFKLMEKDTIDDPLFLTARTDVEVWSMFDRKNLKPLRELVETSPEVFRPADKTEGREENVALKYETLFNFFYKRFEDETFGVEENKIKLYR